MSSMVIRYPFSLSASVFWALVLFAVAVVVCSIVPVHSFTPCAVDLVDSEAKPAQGALERTFSCVAGNNNSSSSTFYSIMVVMVVMVVAADAFFFCGIFFESAHLFQQFNSLAC